MLPGTDEGGFMKESTKDGWAMVTAAVLAMVIAVMVTVVIGVFIVGGGYVAGVASGAVVRGFCAASGVCHGGS
jgi:hypothetical protein